MLVVTVFEDHQVKCWCAKSIIYWHEWPGTPKVYRNKFEKLHMLMHKMDQVDRIIPNGEQHAQTYPINHRIVVL